MILAGARKNHVQVTIRREVAKIRSGKFRWKWGGANALDEGVCVEMGLTEGCRLSFEQSYPRAPSTQKRYNINGGWHTRTMALKPVTKKKKKVS
jgi:hypothetical protein